MNKILLALVLAGALSTHAVAADSYTIDPSHTYPSFEISHLGYSIQRGRFNTTSGKIVLDPAGKAGRVDVTIDAASIDTGLDELEKVLRSDEFFDTAKYPTITFVSRNLIYSADKLTEVHGDFTLHGVTRPVTLKLDHFHCAPNPITKKPHCGANAVTTIRRSDFGIAKFVPLVGDDVKIALQVEAVKD